MSLFAVPHTVSYCCPCDLSSSHCVGYYVVHPAAKESMMHRLYAVDTTNRQAADPTQTIELVCLNSVITINQSKASTQPMLTRPHATPILTHTANPHTISALLTHFITVLGVVIRPIRISPFVSLFLADALPQLCVLTENALQQGVYSFPGNLIPQTLLPDMPCACGQSTAKGKQALHGLYWVSFYASVLCSLAV